MTKDVNVNQLATAVMWWLSYTSAIGRNYVLSEGAIRFPVSEYLERSSVDEIELEYGHPKLARKRFDLFFKKDINEEIAFEFKYIKNGSTRTKDEKQRIFNDLMRLFLFLDKDKKAYFLICGNQVDFVKDFQRITPDIDSYIKPINQDSQPERIIPQGFYEKWFSFNVDKPDTEIDTNDNTPEYKDIYKLFFDEYKNPFYVKTNTKLQLPAKFKTSLVFLSGNLGQPIGVFHPAKIGIWEVNHIS